MQQIERLRCNGWFRQNIFGKEVIWNRRRYVFIPKGQRKKMKNLFIFGLVKKDAKRFVKDNPIGKYKWLKSTMYNDDLNPGRRKIIGTDLNNAYWVIAKDMGAISQSTFEHGIRINDKTLYVATLSSLGADKYYNKILNGKITDKQVVYKGDDQLKHVYWKIRSICFTYMQQLAKMLGPDFVCYRTDCIYYLQSKANIEMVTSFFESKGFDYKMVNDFDGFVE